MLEIWNRGKDFDHFTCEIDLLRRERLYEGGQTWHQHSRPSESHYPSITKWLSEKGRHGTSILTYQSRVKLSFDNKVIEWKRADMAPALSPIRVTLSFNWVKECEPFSSLHIPRYWLKKRDKTLTPIIVIWSFLTFIHHGVKHVKPAQSPIQGPDFDSG